MAASDPLPRSSPAHGASRNLAAAPRGSALALASSAGAALPAEADTAAVGNTLFGVAMRAATGGAIAVFCFMAVTLSINARFNPLYKLSALGAALLVACLALTCGPRDLGHYLRDRFLQRYTLFTALTVTAMFYSPYELGRLTTVLLMFALTIVVFIYVTITGQLWPIFYGLFSGVLAVVALSGGAALAAAQEGERLRYTIGDGGSYQHPNKFGFLLLIVFLLSLKILFVDHPSRRRTFDARWKLHRLGALLGIIVATHQIVTVTGSRKAAGLLLVAAAGAGLLYLARRLSVTRLVTSATISVVALAATWAFVTTSPFFERLMTMQEFVDGGGLADGSSVERTQMMRVGLNMWLESPIFGHGPGYFLKHAGFGAYSHANPVELLVSLGLVGALLYYSSLWAVMRPAFASLIKRDCPDRALPMWVLLVMGLMLLSEIGTVVNFGHVREHAIMLGLTAAYSLHLRLGRQHP